MYVRTAAGGTAAGDGDTTADSAGDGAADAAGNKDSTDEGDDGDGDQATTRNEDGEYELFAVMIHQGTARGGHYYAYIKVVQLYIQSHARIHIRMPLTSLLSALSRAGFKQPPGQDKWFEFNDVNVKELDTAHVQQAFEAAREAQAAAASGGDADTDAKDGDCKADAADGEEEEEDGEDKVSQVAFNMASNAYLVMYRLKNHDAAHHEVKLPPPLAAMVRVGGADTNTSCSTQHSRPPRDNR